MNLFSALNEGISSHPSGYRRSVQSEERVLKPFSQEAEESEALKLYQRAISAHHAGDESEADGLYRQLLQTRFVALAPESLDEENLHMSKECQLKYVAYKNLATLTAKQGNYKTALEYYMKALQLDSSDASLWYHTGVAGMEYGNLVLARHALNQGLHLNQLHWLCLHKLCTVLYTLGDDSACLEMSVEGLERDAAFTQGLVFVHKLYEESSYLLQWKRNPRRYMKWLSLSVDSTDVEEVSEEVKRLGKNRDRLVEQEKQSVEQLKLKLQQPTWESFGCSVLQLYNRVKKSEGKLWFSEPVDVSQAVPLQQPDICASPLTPTAINFALFRASPLGLSQTSDGDSCDQGKKGQKRKISTLTEDFDLAPKRRSTRVKTNMRKKEEETVNYSERLQWFVPPKLKPPTHVDDSLSQRLSSSLSSSRLDLVSSGSAISGISIHWNEMENVQESLSKCKQNSGVIDLLYRFAAELGDPKRSKTKWSNALVSVFLQVYVALRKHIMLPFSPGDEPEEESVEKSHFVLCACELQLDSHKGSKPHDSDSNCLLRDFHIGTSTTFSTDVDFLVAMTTTKQAFGPAWQNFTIRVYWLRARFGLLIGQTIMAIDSFCICADLLAMERPVDAALDMLPRQPLTIQLPNCIEDLVISEERVKEKLEFIDRFRSLDEVRSLYNAGDYNRVVEILTLSLNLTDMFNPTVMSLYGKEEQESLLSRPSPERPSQLLILEDALFKVGRVKDALLCAEQNLHEVTGRLTPQLVSKTAETLKELVSTVDRAVASTELLNSVPLFVLARMLQSIIKFIDCYMDTAESITEFFPVTIPWVIAIRLVQFGEISDISTDLLPAGEQPLGTGNASMVVASTGRMSLLSHLLLRDAHEKLGRHFVCCEDDGKFLELSLSIFLGCLQDTSDEELIRDIEQCFLCLYGHPNKKAKTKKLQDHGSSQIELTWDKVTTVFTFFCPAKQRPTFDVKKSYVTTELENLLRRIVCLIPSTEQPAISSKSLLSYIDGTFKDIPTFTSDMMDANASQHPVVLEVFYLLADFYRRNGESIKAVKFYMQDLMYNPQRFDSWAGMAEARAKKIGDRLNALDRKLELYKVVERESGPALRSFEIAMKINSTSCMLLEHYGLLCYTLHSFAAQQTRQLPDDSPSLSWLSQLRSEMLVNAGELFELCLACSDGCVKSYVYDLMVGKVAEKTGRQYDVFLERYIRALNWLDEKQIHPRRIDYRNPLDYSIETLAVYHHLHTAVLKILQDVQLEYLSLIKFDSLEKYVEIASKSAFAQADSHLPLKGAARLLFLDSAVHGDCSSRSLLEFRKLVLEEHCYAKMLVDMNQEGDNRDVASCVNVEGQQTMHQEQQAIESGNAANQNTSHTAATKSGIQATQQTSGSQSLPATDCSDNQMKENVIAETDKSDDAKKNVVSDTKLEEAVGNANVPALVASETPQAATERSTDRETSSIHEFDREQSHEDDLSLPMFPISPLPLLGDLDSLPHGLEDVNFNLNVLSPDAGGGEGEKVKENREEEMLVTGEVQSSVSEMSAVSRLSPMERYMMLVGKCLDALHLCVFRYPEHYKSIYRLAYAYSHIPTHMNLELARDLLWGSPQQEGRQQLQPLFSRKGTNFFQIWKMRIDELERPGSFQSHVNKSVCLLIKVLEKLEDRPSLLTVIQMLLKKADPSRRYLPESEKMNLLKKAMVAHLNVTQDKITQLRLAGGGKEHGKKLTQDVCLNVLELLLVSYQAKVVCMKNDCDCPEIESEMAQLFGLLAPRLEEAWKTVSSCSDETRERVLAEEAMSFCQHNFILKQPVESGTSVGVPSQFRVAVEALFPCDKS
ncbi:calcineurin-binding protein cabin-1-like [Corticium candelabrum]|uniref:calcineurin-binding protein cabin-1-like n=1 Tax=Corticium candelabrum TaxID=121492 RepID=UPI002E261864|nr:calcineurin-binding protein cabin-1-like [Corticium candelabrum]